MSTDHDEVRMLLGAYVLGGLGEADRRIFEAHIATCDECREDVARSAPLPGLLRRAPAGSGSLAAAGPLDTSPPALDRLLAQVREVRASDRRRARVRWLVAAAIVALAGVGLAVLPSWRDGEPGGTTATFTAVGGQSLSGQATLTSKPWGTSVAVSMADLPPDGPFVLQVTSEDGVVEQACTWGATPAASARVTGASSVDMADIESVTVLDIEGNVLAVSDDW